MAPLDAEVRSANNILQKNRKKKKEAVSSNENVRTVVFAYEIRRALGRHAFFISFLFCFCFFYTSSVLPRDIELEFQRGCLENTKKRRKKKEVRTRPWEGCFQGCLFLFPFRGSFAEDSVVCSFSRTNSSAFRLFGRRRLLDGYRRLQSLARSLAAL